MRYRRVPLYDDLRAIAQLLYDAKVSKSWQKMEVPEDDCVQFIATWLCMEDFLYYYKNLYIAAKDEDRYPVAVVGGVKSADSEITNFDYAVFEDAYHISNIVNWLKILPENEVMITAFCVDPSYRDEEIGLDLLTHYVHDMGEHGYSEFRLDWNAEDRASLDRYGKIGFRQIGESAHPVDADARIANLTLSLA